MHNLAELLSHSVAIYDDITNDRYVGAARHLAQITLLACDELEDAGFKSMPPTPGSDPEGDKEKLDEALDNLKNAQKELKAAKKPPAKGKAKKGKAAPVGDDHESLISPSEILVLLNFVIKLFQRWRQR